MIELPAMRQTLFLRDFTVLDFAFLGKEGLQGESLYVSVELQGELDAQGFILDFGPAKKILKAIVDETLDHKLVIPGLHPSLKGTAKGLKFAELLYEAPDEAVEVLEGEEITPALLEDFLQAEAMSRLPANVKGVKFSLRPDSRFELEPNFRYTHGLRLHNGNCQRLLHGHRNPVEVWLEGKRSTEWENFLVKEWENAHFTFAPTLKNRAELDFALGRRQHQHPGMAEIEYESPQGFFRAEISASRIILLETEPSIENIARLGANRLRSEGILQELRVVAYEGLNKGASFTLLP